MSARKTADRERRPHSELDGAVNLYSVSSSMLCGRRGGVYCTVGSYSVFFILDPETRKNKLISPSFFPLLCRFTRKIRHQNPDSTLARRMVYAYAYGCVVVCGTIAAALLRST